MTANRKDLICGLVFIAIAILFALGTRDLEFGTTTRMGPGYFPLVLSGILGLLGVLIAFKAFSKADEPFGEIPFRAIILIVSALVFFGFSVRGMGLFPATMIVALAASFSSRKMTIPLALTLSVIMALFCSAVFVWGLGLPIQLFGPWVRF